MNPQAVESFAWVLIHFLWQGTCIALVYKSAAALDIFQSSRHRYVLGLLCLTCMLLSPVATYLLRDSVITSLKFDSAIATADAEAAMAENIRGGNWSLFVIAIWITGVALQGIRLSMGYRRLRRWQTHVLPLPDSLLQRSFEFASRLGLSRFRRIYLSTHVREAMAVGFFRPMILVPASWLTQLPTSTLEAVIAHELAHIRRFDLWINLYQRTVETLLFYHPAVWWLSSRIRDERELCCDEIAARTTGNNLEYALALEDVARCVYRETPLLGMSFSGEKNMKLLKRVRHVLGLSTMAKRSLWWPAGLLALMLPLAFYASSLLADDEEEIRDRPAAERREGEREPSEQERAEDRPREGERERDGDRPRPERERDGDRPRPESERDSDRPRPEQERDGDRPRPEREREDDRPRTDRERGDGTPREGFRPRREGFRPDGPRPDGPRPDGPRPPLGDRNTPFRDRFEGDRPERPLPPPNARRDDDLRREVEQLRREVNELKDLLRQQRSFEGPPRKEGEARNLPKAVPPVEKGKAPAKQAGNLKEPDKQTSSLKQPVKPSVDAKKPGKQIEKIKRPLEPTDKLKVPEKQIGKTKELSKPTDKLKEPVKEIEKPGEPVKQIEKSQEPIPNE
ncbi:MAG TPA: M56 family metallopeptidase [Planctomycetaceae bacterium]|nr:M56 family metallopeptidase [Planctomycetaceae bacterium]